MPSEVRDLGLQRALRHLPSVDEVLKQEAARSLLAQVPRWAVLRAVQQAIAAAREEIRQGRLDAQPRTDRASLQSTIELLRTPSLRRVVNATGVVLHTNLGRAPLANEAIDRVVDVARGYSSLEYDTEAKGRGSRHDHVVDLLTELCGAEAACVVNNNAAAVALTLAALANGREVIISRGELVEIGGSFRIPDVMRASGAILREVGTTNKTRLSDYRQAYCDATALFFKVHRSNFAQVGFVADVSLAELAMLAREKKIPLAFDLGSGSLLDGKTSGLPSEPTPREAIAAGADLVMFSGDKLLGGPQAGILVGSGPWIQRLKNHPLMRVVRPDKLTLAALGATLSLYRDGRSGAVPIVGMLTTSPDTLRRRARSLAARLRKRAPAIRCEVVRVTSQVGGGALPLAQPESFGLALQADFLPTEQLEKRLRQNQPPIVARIERGRVLLDVRCIFDHDMHDVVLAITRATEEP